MDLENTVLTCALNMQWTNNLGITGRKLTYRVGTLRLVRNDLRELFIEFSADKVKPIKFKLKDVMIHKKFMSEGKASINFRAENCTVYLSNAPPGTLMYFLRTIFIKLNGTENEVDDGILQQKLRAHMLSGKPSNFEEISPVTTAEMVMARKKAGLVATRGSTTTPSPQAAKKRRFDELKGSDIKPAAKKLYQENKAADNLLGDDAVSMCPEQLEVLKTCTAGKSIFFTGSAGTGKSFLLRKIISALPPDGTVATASTGVAACLIGGVTLHAFASIGSGDFGLQRCLELASRPASAQTWRKCKRLIIDEISMVDGQFFDKIEAVARHVRKNDRPFGGIQLILCGDFLQLPPVTRAGQNDNTTNAQRFCFQSKAWETCVQCYFELKQVHRQSDPEFINILNHLRIGHVNDEISKRLSITSKQKIESNGILATQLCSHTNDANSINESKLDNLPGESILFSAEDTDPKMSKQMDAQLQAPAELYLKINAQVMLLRNVNIAAGLVNGARGVVVRIEKGVPVVRFKNNQEYACKHEKWTITMPNGSTMTRRQVPLKLAWAFSIHKSQGLTLDCVEMSLSKVFEAGQAYVALSRAKSLDSVRILDFDAKQVWANPHVLQFYKLFRRRLHDSTMIALGPRKDDNKSTDPRLKALDKLKKSLIAKPIVSIS